MRALVATLVGLAVCLLLHGQAADANGGAPPNLRAPRACRPPPISHGHPVLGHASLPGLSCLLRSKGMRLKRSLGELVAEETDHPTDDLPVPARACEPRFQAAIPPQPVLIGVCIHPRAP